MPRRVIPVLNGRCAAAPVWDGERRRPLVAKACPAPMQTFLPYPDCRRSLECLDTRRLGKQRVEAMQLLNAAQRTTGGWIRHPAKLMWAGHEEALRLYHNQIGRAHV